MWDYTGMVVSGQYMGDIPVTGRVEMSRVKYGGGICHTVVLKESIEIYGNIRDRVIIDHENIERIFDNYGIVR